MPELPEVETVRRGLEKVLPGQELGPVEVRLSRCFVGEPKSIEGTTIKTLRRRGKLLMIDLEEELSLLVHLRMTGQLIFVPKDGGLREGGGHPSGSLIEALPSKHTHVIMPLSSGDTLYYNDQRTFGSVKVFPTALLDEEPFLQKLGPEPWDRSWNAPALQAVCKRRKSASIKAILLDQHVVAGIGNIYADESLFLSKILPTTVGRTLSLSKLRTLIKNVRVVLERGIEFGGVSARNYVNAEGLRGTMQEQLYVYKREGMPCKVCAHPIQKISHAGRGTHFCAKCQR